MKGTCQHGGDRRTCFTCNQYKDPGFGLIPADEIPTACDSSYEVLAHRTRYPHHHCTCTYSTECCHCDGDS